MSQPIVEKEAGPPANSDIKEAPAAEKKVREYKEFGHDVEAKPARTLLSLGLRVDFRV